MINRHAARGKGKVGAGFALGASWFLGAQKIFGHRSTQMNTDWPISVSAPQRIKPRALISHWTKLGGSGFDLVRAFEDCWSDRARCRKR
jgi:hypothetical protein